MSKREYEIAAEFCSLVKAPDLLEYLQLGVKSPDEEVREKLKKRRKYMQGMQSNPKYRKEALFLIKHFSALSRALENTAEYQADAQRRAESVHLPILEMTIKGVLAGGTLSDEQDNYLKRNANELGVSDATFDKLMARLCAEAGIARAQSPLAGREIPTLPPVPVDTSEDYYTLLGLDSRASAQEIEYAFDLRMRESNQGETTPETEAHQVRLKLAHKVLTDPQARAQYKVNQTRTGPPARQRQRAPVPIASGPPPFGRVPPVRSPNSVATSRLEILGDPQRLVNLNQETQAQIRIRNRGSEAMTGRITTEELWIELSQHHIEPTQPEQTIDVTFRRDLIPSRTAEGSVQITTDQGESATITYRVVQRSSAKLVLAGALLVGLLSLSAWVVGVFERPIDVDFVVEPMAAEFLLDGVSKGSGTNFGAIAMQRAPHSVVIHHPNFETLQRTFAPEELTDGPVHLKLIQKKAMDFQPHDGLKKGNLNQLEAQAIVSKRGPAFIECIRQAVPPGEILEGRIRIHIEPSGLAAGITIDGAPPEDPVALSCIERQAAAVQLSPISDGDYATVRYNYSVKGTTDGS